MPVCVCVHVCVCVCEHRLQQCEYKWAHTVNLRSQSVAFLFFFGYTTSRVTKLGNRGELQRATERGLFMSNCTKKLELIYVLQVDMGLIAMVTGHVPHHLPSPPPAVPSSPTAITRFREMTLIFSLCHRCCLWISPHWMLNIHHPPRHPGETWHPLINSPSVSLLVSLSTHLSLVIHHGISLFLTITQQKKKQTNYVLTQGGNRAELKCSPAPDAYFPAEYLNDHSVVCWLFGLFISYKTFSGEKL